MTLPTHALVFAATREVRMRVVTGAEARARQKIRRQAILLAAEAFDVDPHLVRLGIALRRTGRKDLCNAVFRGWLCLQEAFKIARRPRDPQRNLFELDREKSGDGGADD